MIFISRLTVKLFMLYLILLNDYILYLHLKSRTDRIILFNVKVSVSQATF